MDFVISLKHEEQNLVQACINKERWAQKKLYEDNYPKMMPVCLRYANHREDAMDILHEGFIKVFIHIEKYQPGTSLHSWIRRIMVNTAIDYYRKEVRRRTESLDNAYKERSNDPDVVSLMSAAEITACLQELSPAYRAVFNLYVVEGFPHKDIADQLGISESTSRSNLVKARVKLRNIIYKRGIKRNG